MARKFYAIIYPSVFKVTGLGSLVLSTVLDIDRGGTQNRPAGISCWNRSSGQAA